MSQVITLSKVGFLKRHVLLVVFFVSFLLVASIKNFSVESSITPDRFPEFSGINGVAMCGSADNILANVSSRSHSGTFNVPVGSNISGLRKWSSTSTWTTNSIPQSSDIVTIPSNSVVVIDRDVNVKAIKVEGKLIVDLSKDINISAEYIVVSGSSGYLEWGTENEPYNKKGVITLKGSNKNTMVPGTAINYKTILVQDRAKLELHGENKISWTRLGENAPANQNKITVLTANTGWKVGDEIVVVSSRLNPNEAEKRTITAVSGDKKTFTLNSNLQYPHIGKKKLYTRDKDGKTWDAEIRAEVGCLTKSIKIQGDASSDANKFGGHIMIHRSGIAHVENIELYRMGQTAIKGRYPWHWHLLEEKGAGQYLKNSSIHKSFSRAITVHGTESTLTDGNFAYDHLGHGFFLEDGSERFNIIKNNVMVLSKRPTDAERLTPSDNQFNEPQNRTPSQFWITNPNNVFEGNVAAGTVGTGFWFAMPTRPIQESRSIARFTNLQPHKEKLGGFSGNISHSCVSGFDIFDQIDENHSIQRNRPWDRTDKRYIDKHIFYANDLANYGGIGGGRSRTVGVTFRDNIYSDNKTCIMQANFSTFDNCLFVANSGENVFSGERRLNRGYDGACTIKNSHLVGWDASNANYVQNTGGADKHTNYIIEGITLSPNKSVRMNFPSYAGIPKGRVGANAGEHPRFWSYVHWDKDGSISGKPNTSIVTNHPLCRDGSEVRYANWTNLYRTDRRFGYLTINGQGEPRATLIRTKSGTPKAGQYYINGAGFYGGKIQFPVMVNDDFLYTLQFDKLSTNKQLSIRLLDAYTPGDQVLYRIKDFGRLSGFTVSSATKRNNLSEVKSYNGTAWAKVGNDIYLKMKVGTNPDLLCRLSWTNNITLPILDSDGDGISDEQESNDGTDPVGNDPIPDAQVIEWDTGNSLPVASFVEPTNDTFIEGYNRLYVKVNASDPDNDPLNLILYVTGRGEIRHENNPPYEWGHVSATDPTTETELLGLAPGEYEFKVRVSDGKGGVTRIYKTITIKEAKAPYSGSPIFLPGVIEAEHYDKGGQGVSYNDLDPENKGGAASNFRVNEGVDIGLGNGSEILGWTSDGEWVEYTVNVDETNTYELEFYTASIYSDGQIRIMSDGSTLLGAIDVPNTGAWDSYTSFKHELNLIEGEQVIRVHIEKGRFNLDKIVFSKKVVTSNAIVPDAELLSVYPNPSASGIFNLSKEAEWKVYSITGKLLQEGDSRTINLSNQSNGSYLLKSNGKEFLLQR